LPLGPGKRADYSDGKEGIARQKMSGACLKKMSGDPLSDVGGSTPEGISRSTAIMYIYAVTATGFFV
jgi:hypothetical protein